MKHFRLILATVSGLMWAVPGLAQIPGTSAIEAKIRVNAGATLGDLKPIWRFFGADEPNYAYMQHGQKLLAELGELRPK
jgi:xylan 1,4-beta-xylosidase